MRRRYRRVVCAALAVLSFSNRQGGLLFAGGPAAEATPSRTEELAKYFQRPVNEVSGLRDQGLGYGEIAKILVIARMSRRPLPDMLARNSQGYGWGTISRELGLNPREVQNEVSRARADLHIRVKRD
jgi:hypothetical protein